MGTFKLGQTPPWEIERIARRYVKRNPGTDCETAIRLVLDRIGEERDEEDIQIMARSAAKVLKGMNIVKQIILALEQDEAKKQTKEPEYEQLTLFG
ncbi:hypothetical protein GCM10007416_00530 [Kroppenstedtia guangzhouensis]|uniref:Uncharacterized protein n=1 Tax=Kroppenstedtia guangzhouensis TaxID=1274356 RepID=A0ABQ1FWT2_9BACL|nr:hypothetical protein [Kroppenstedtia guangzhouensis]GGA31898.1 hypothetical protein GCM10007416_00530 [Kroppenstedtia guangzhouensis]